MKHSGQIQLFNLWSKGFISACSSRPQSVTKGTQVGAEAETMEDCSSTNLLSGSRSASSLGQPISTCLGMVLPIVGWVLPRQSSAKALPQRLGHSLPDGGNSSVEMRLPRGLKIVSSWQQKSIHYTFLVFPFCGRQKNKRKKKKLLQNCRNHQDLQWRNWGCWTNFVSTWLLSIGSEISQRPRKIWTLRMWRKDSKEIFLVVASEKLTQTLGWVRFFFFWGEAC